MEAATGSTSVNRARSPSGWSHKKLVGGLDLRGGGVGAGQCHGPPGAAGEVAEFGLLDRVHLSLYLRHDARGQIRVARSVQSARW